MFSVKSKARIAGLAAVAAAMTLPGAVSAGVVVKSAGPSASTYPVGKKVADSSTITLRPGDKITVLVNGGTKVMQGPGTFRVGEGATRTRARFARLTRQGASSRARTGAVRGGGSGSATMPNLWMVNVAAAGTTCLYDLENVQLWRPAADKGQTYLITQKGADRSLGVTFVETESMRALDPEGMKLADGATYTITGPGPEGTSPASVDVKIVQLTETYRQPDALAGALAENGCMGQLGVLGNIAEAEAS
ncbi:hypothetical protein INR77_12650 [Erythrobacter sp. SCSIO 43205]|uniref:hypothetical protein n=1 Tax=Erythrobacter sp. SCSIO 43205 TaxID=2779361 RepID=UPI001CA9488D|nr:hypothetical protein [Erythrobacter sp. SCSIO 43205]UAB77629.1 hypothetical protein INR77_12650 [Erythrobacter sp. SCSIO 43205]